MIVSAANRLVDIISRFMRRRFRILIGLAISAACIYYLLGRVDLTTLRGVFRDGNYLYLLPGLLLLVAINWSRTIRWRILIGSEAPSQSRLFDVVNIGYLLNNVLPAKAGELARAYLVGRMIPGGFGGAASTLLVERLLDVLAVVFLLVILIPFVAVPEWVANAGLLFGILAVAGVIALVFLSRLGGRAIDWSWRFVGRIPVLGRKSVRNAVDNVFEGLGALAAGNVVLPMVFWTGVVWLGYAVFNYVIMQVFPALDLPFASAALVLCATGLSMVVPSTPGAIGPFEAAAVLALSVFGVEESPALGYALGLHMFTNLSLVAFGVVGLVREGLSFGGVRRGAASAGTSGDMTVTSQEENVGG